MVAVYADAPPLNDVNRQLLNFIEVYEQNGSGWVFSNFVSFQLSLWYLDPLRAGWKLPVGIHNLQGYDGHLIVKVSKSEFGKVRVIPQNMEKHLSLTVGQLKFIDSFQISRRCRWSREDSCG